MGTVYEAVDERLGSVVAVKETAFADEGMRGQFEREGRLLAQLSHPALPRVSDYFAEDGGHFLVMQFVGGEDLDAMRRAREGGLFPVAQVLAWADQLLDALEYLHTRQPPVIHRDIKPQNLKLGERGQIVLLDFGLAKGYASGTSPLAPAASVFGYTPAYAPLEQIQGAGTEARSDLYSLAATLYQLLTGVAPPNALARADAILNGQPDPLRPADELKADVSQEVAAVLRGAMALRRDERPASAAAMRRALREAVETPRAQTHGGNPPAFVVAHPRPERPAHPADAWEASNSPAALDASGETPTVVAVPHRPTPRPAPERRSRMFWPVVLAGLFLLGFAGAVLTFVFLKSFSNPPERPATNNRTVNISTNTSNANVATTNRTANVANSNRTANATANTEEPDKPVASSEGVGVAECDDFIRKYEACINDKVPAMAHSMLKSHLEAMRDGWKKAAETPQGRVALKQGCKMAVERAKTSMSGYGCSW